MSRIRAEVEVIRQQIYALISKDREKQDEKWGQQDHFHELWLAILMEEIGEVCAEVIRAAPIDWTVTEELIQVAAVVVAYIESGLRQGLLELPPTEEAEDGRTQ